MAAYPQIEHAVLVTICAPRCALSEALVFITGFQRPFIASSLSNVPYPFDSSKYRSITISQ